MIEKIQTSKEQQLGHQTSKEQQCGHQTSKEQQLGHQISKEQQLRHQNANTSTEHLGILDLDENHPHQNLTRLRKTTRFLKLNWISKAW